MLPCWLPGCWGWCRAVNSVCSPAHRQLKLPASDVQQHTSQPRPYPRHTSPAAALPGGQSVQGRGRRPPQLPLLSGSGALLPLPRQAAAASSAARLPGGTERLPARGEHKGRVRTARASLTIFEAATGLATSCRTQCILLCRTSSSRMNELAPTVLRLREQLPCRPLPSTVMEALPLSPLPL